jgi:hypothetical protein
MYDGDDEDEQASSEGEVNGSSSSEDGGTNDDEDVVVEEEEVAADDANGSEEEEESTAGEDVDGSEGFEFTASDVEAFLGDRPETPIEAWVREAIAGEVSSVCVRVSIMLSLFAILLTCTCSSLLLFLCRLPLYQRLKKQ